jgi:hypothetical protein
MKAPLHGRDLGTRSRVGKILTIEASFLSEPLLGLVVALFYRVYFDQLCILTYNSASPNQLGRQLTLQNEVILSMATRFHAHRYME